MSIVSTTQQELTVSSVPHSTITHHPKPWIRQTPVSPVIAIQMELWTMEIAIRSWVTMVMSDSVTARCSQTLKTAASVYRDISTSPMLIQKAASHVTAMPRERSTAVLSVSSSLASVLVCQMLLASTAIVVLPIITGMENLVAVFLATQSAMNVKVLLRHNAQ